MLYFGPHCRDERFDSEGGVPRTGILRLGSECGAPHTGVLRLGRVDGFPHMDNLRLGSRRTVSRAGTLRKIKQTLGSLQTADIK
jgi:hypothetical protein